MPTCKYCYINPSISKSHLIPDFIGKYIKKNSPFGYMLSNWSNKNKFDLDTGPYLCSHCDNCIFGIWETHFSNHLWSNLLTTNKEWHSQKTLNFFIAIAYRYSIHFYEKSPIVSNRQYFSYFNKLTKYYLKNNTHNKLHIYPYVYQPITSGCEFLPGINHFLSLSAHCRNLPNEQGGDLPNSMLIVLPKMLILVCDKDLKLCTSKTMRNPVELTLSGSFDPFNDNIDMPYFLSSVLNRYINNSQSHQKQIGKWKKLNYGHDKITNPHKLCYVTQGYDKTLKKWQLANGC